MNTNVVGLDIAKNIFHLYSLGADGKATKKKLIKSGITEEPEKESKTPRLTSVPVTGYRCHPVSRHQQQ